MSDVAGRCPFFGKPRVTACKTATLRSRIYLEGLNKDFPCVQPREQPSVRPAIHAKALDPRDRSRRSGAAGAGRPSQRA